MVNIHRILCPIDFSEFSLDALRHGLVLADWYSAEMTLLHVYPLFQPLPFAGAPRGVPVDDIDPDTVAEEVRRFCAPLIGSSRRNVDVVVRSGDAAREIRAEVERLPADLVVLATHGRSGFERLFLGSVTEKVLRSTRVPVLTIPPPVREPGSPLYKTILCALEFAPTSIRALEHAMVLAKAADARLILLHVVEGLLGDAGAQTRQHLSVSDYYREVEQEAVARLQAVIPDDAHVWARPEVRVVRGRAHEEILRAVAKEHVDLVVMGVQGKNVLNRVVFGSTTHRVISEAGCPVLTLHGGRIQEDSDDRPSGA